MLQLWEVRILLTRMYEAAMTWSDKVPTYKEGEAKSSRL